MGRHPVQGPADEWSGPGRGAGAGLVTLGYACCSESHPLASQERGQKF